MEEKDLINSVKIKSIKSAASIWGSFKVRGDSFVEFLASCSKDGWTLEEAKQVHTLVSKEVTIECALDAVSRGQINKDQFLKIKSSIEKSFQRRNELLNHQNGTEVITEQSNGT